MRDTSRMAIGGSGDGVFSQKIKGETDLAEEIAESSPNAYRRQHPRRYVAGGGEASCCHEARWS
jgi:hypothetical protein